MDRMEGEMLEQFSWGVFWAVLTALAAWAGVVLLAIIGNAMD